MSDVRLRELERRRRETGDPDDEAAWVRESVRAGRVAPERVVVAAALGHEAARRALPDAAPSLELREALTAAGQLVAARVAISAAVALADGWGRSRLYRSRPELASTLAAARAWVLAPSGDVARAARDAAKALERVMGRPDDSRADLETEDHVRVASWTHPRSPAERAAGAAIIAATTCARSVARARVVEVTTDGVASRRELTLEAITADYAARAVNLAEGAAERLRAAVVPWLLDPADPTDPLTGLGERLPKASARSKRSDPLLTKLRSLRGTPTPRYTAADARDPVRHDTALLGTASEFGARVVRVLQGGNANAREGTVAPEHVAQVVAGAPTLPVKDGLAWYWIDAEELASTTSGRATLVLVVYLPDADEVRVAAYHRPRPSERRRVWGYTTGGSPTRLALSLRSKAAAIATWTLFGPVARASREVADDWARALLASDAATRP